jgi:hypothetical protein
MTTKTKTAKKRGAPTLEERAAKAEEAKWKYRETDIVKFLGLPKDLMKELRDPQGRFPFPKGEYKTAQGKTCMYTESGLDIICKRIGAITPVDAKKAIAEGIEIAHQEEVRYGICRNMNFVNPSIIMCSMCDTDENIRVKVGPAGNGNFKTGMIVPIVRIEGEKGYAHKMPTSKGVWR